MKITMLGTSGVGKTTLMAAMYHVLGRRGFNGFKLRAERDLDLRLASLWEQMALRGKWPLSTLGPDIQRMHFDLLYNDNPVISFEFIDYRGDAIKDTSEHSDAKELYEEMLGSNALLIIVDSWYMVNVDQIYGEIRNQIHNIQNLIDDFYIQYPDKQLAIGIVLTKFDSVTPQQFAAVVHNCFHQFERLVTKIRRNSAQMRGTFIPVSVAGFGNTEIIVTKPAGRFGLPVVDSQLVRPPQPAYVHWPILYSIAKQMQYDSDATLRSIVNREREVQRAYSQMSVLDSVRAYLDGRESNESKFRRLWRENTSDRRRLEDYHGKLQPLLDEVAILPEISVHDRIFRPFV